MFDLDFVTSAFQTTNLKFYLDQFKTASNIELRNFRKKVKLHSKSVRQQQAFSNVDNYTTHDAIVAAINYELLKRSKLYKVYKFIFPGRRLFVKAFSGIELKEHESFGTLYCKPKYVSSIWHKPHGKIFKNISSFLARNWANLILCLCAIGGLVFIILNFINSHTE